MGQVLVNRWPGFSRAAVEGGGRVDRKKVEGKRHWEVHKRQAGRREVERERP